VSVPRVLHVLPHRGGGGEIYVGFLERLDGYAHERVHLSKHVEAMAAAPSLVPGLVRAGRAARRADIVHVHGDTGTLLTLPALGGRPRVWATHGLHLLRRSTGKRRALVERGLRAAIRAARVTVCTSSGECDDLAALVRGRPEADRLARVIVGIPAPSREPDARERVRSELGLAPDTTACLFVGSLEPRKQPLLAARAVAEARRAGADLELLVAGDGPLRTELEAAAGDGVRALGFRDDVGRLMAAADVFVLPSVREGLPLALLEAMSNAVVPVIAEDPGSVEAVGDAGIAVPAGDAAALAAALARLARDPAERRRLGDAARARYEERFRLERFLEEMDAVYRRALSL
jgi:glycosyltransferase involved in cell wall biosynthesis